MNEIQILNQERVLVLAPTSADAALSRSILTEAGLACHVCADLSGLVRELDQGVGAILLTEEVLAANDAQYLIKALHGQPPWSDIPILLLSISGADSSVAAWAMELLGNVTVLERPVRVTTLVSALRAAIRARRRQYELHDQLNALTRSQDTLRQSEERLRLLWEAAAVLLTTEDPDAMLRGVFAKIAPHFGWDTYFHFIVNEADDALRLQSCVGIPEEEARKITWLEFGQAVCRTVALNCEPIVATHIQRSEDPKVQLVKRYGIQAYACNPLIIEGRLLGTLCFASRQRDQFDSDELEFLKTICQYVTVAHERVRLIRQLRETDYRKDEFLATLAHELRNPLAPISNGLQIMRLSGNNGAPAEQALTVMERQLRQLVRLIDDLLDVSRITQGKLSLRKERVELATMIKNAVDTISPLIEASGHELTISLPPQPIYLDADPVRLAQVFSNLLNNAAKYTESGGHIWLTAELSPSAITEGARREVVVTVRDTGMGIPAEALPSIFEIFKQVDRSLEKSQGGLGIGLTLVKRLAEMHGGSVSVRSQVGRGSQFAIHLPVVSASPGPQPPSSQDERSASAVKCRILVADDNRDAAESMSMMLRLMGHEVRTVHDGVQAVDEAAAFRPDVILLDIGMPQLNGYEAARRIREQRWGKGMVLVALTGWGKEEDKHRASEVGFDQHFTKPVNAADLERLMLGLGADSSPRPHRTER
jgi:signal transduction histidine kinase/CheY-like chemotaxis protein